MPNWDYSGHGYYFITLATKNRECNLGKIVQTDDGASVILSNFGKIVNTEWLKSFQIRNELIMDIYIIMSNHLHAIVVIDNLLEETNNKAFLQQSKNQLFLRKQKSISSYIGCFKSAVNSKIDDYIDKNDLYIPKYNRHNPFFEPNYYDHIIRDEAEYQRITKYIIDNPIQWEKDQLKDSNRNSIIEQTAKYNHEDWMII